MEWAATTKSETNDARRVAWVHFFNPSLFLTLINVFNLHLATGSTDKIQIRMKKEASDDENGSGAVCVCIVCFH